LAGFFRKMNFGLQVGYIVGVMGRFVMVFLSGVIFFAHYAPEGQHVFIYSAIYNITYIGPELVVSLIIISLPSMKHAIDVVTKSVVSPTDYIVMMKNRGSVTARARLVTGAVMGAFGGLAFVLVSYITRLETFTITQYITGNNLFAEITSRIPRMIERNTGHIVGLQVAGVLFLAAGVALVFSTLLPQDKKTE